MIRRMILGALGLITLFVGFSLGYTLIYDAAMDGPLLIVLWIIALATLAYGCGLVVEALIRKIKEVRP